MKTETLLQVLQLLSSEESKSSEPINGRSGGDIRIVVLQRGWVAVGRYWREGNEVIIEQAKIIRRWGTTKGLGELVNGPLPDTVLDPAGSLQQHYLAVVTTFACEEGSWLSVL